MLEISVNSIYRKSLHILTPFGVTNKQYLFSFLHHQLQHVLCFSVEKAGSAWVGQVCWRICNLLPLSKEDPRSIYKSVQTC